MQCKGGIEALLRKINRGLDNGGERQRAIFRLRMNQASNRTWNTSSLTRK